MDYENLLIIGTSHIAKQSLYDIDHAYDSINPDIVCIELDRQRLYSLFSDKKKSIDYRAIRKVGIKGFLFALIGSWISKRLGKRVGMMPGDEMKHAVNKAKQRDASIYLIDRNIQVTLRRLKFTWRERWNLLKDIFMGIFGMFGKSMRMDLSKVPANDLIGKIIERVKVRYPSLYRVLIHERDKHMANRLIRIMKKYPDSNILAVVGAGHKQGMLKIIKEKWDKIEVIN